MPIEDVAEILERCPVCGDPVKARIKKDHAWEDKIITPLCRCEEAIRNARENGMTDEEQRYMILRNRRDCFSDPKTAAGRFSRDRRKGSRLADTSRKYVRKFDEMRKKGQGLTFYGSVGTGKSFYAACICNTLLDAGWKCLFTDLNREINYINSDFAGKQERLDRLGSYDLIVLDDVGKERQTDYIREQIIEIMDTIYRNEIPLIVTMNESPFDLTGSSDLFDQRVYTRLIEFSTPVNADGENMRITNAKERGNETWAILNNG